MNYVAPCGWSGPSSDRKVRSSKWRKDNAGTCHEGVPGPAGPAQEDRLGLPRMHQGHSRDRSGEGRTGHHGKDLPYPWLLLGHHLERRRLLPPDGGVRSRRGRLREPLLRQVPRLPDDLRNVQPPQVAHGTRPDRPHEPLQPEVPRLFRERERRGLRLRADPGADSLHAEDAPGAEAGRNGRRSVLGRGTDALSAVPGRRVDGAGPRFQAGPGRDQRYPGRE